MNPRRIAVHVGAQWLNFDVFSTTLDTLLASRKVGSVELATVPYGEYQLVQQYTNETAKQLQMYPSETDEILRNVDEVIVFMDDLDDQITKNMIESGRERGLPIQVILVGNPHDED